MASQNRIIEIFWTLCNVQVQPITMNIRLSLLLECCIVSKHCQYTDGPIYNFMFSLSFLDQDVYTLTLCYESKVT